MAKVKLNLSLDSDIKERLEVCAKERHMTVSALITQYALTLKTNQVRGQMNMADVEKGMKQRKGK